MPASGVDRDRVAGLHLQVEYHVFAGVDVVDLRRVDGSDGVDRDLHACVDIAGVYDRLVLAGDDLRKRDRIADFDGKREFEKRLHSIHLLLFDCGPVEWRMRAFDHDLRGLLLCEEIDLHRLDISVNINVAGPVFIKDADRFLLAEVSVQPDPVALCRRIDRHGDGDLPGLDVCRIEFFSVISHVVRRVYDDVRRIQPVDVGDTVSSVMCQLQRLACAVLDFESIHSVPLCMP